jgi:uncharacterized protein (TIGR02677 family)
MLSPATTLQADLFRHVSAEKAALYRSVMETFAAAKRQFRLHLRPDEVLAEGHWSTTPRIEDIQTVLNQLVDWGNLESMPDMARVSSINDYYRARMLYRLSRGGEAVESSLQVFTQTLGRQAQLQSLALEDITTHLQTLQILAEQPYPDSAKVHATLRDLVRVFESLVENAQAFMVDIARSLSAQQAQLHAVLAYKNRLIDYLQRFIGDLVSRSSSIEQRIEALTSKIKPLLLLAAQREARDHAPGATEQPKINTLSEDVWNERWRGLRLWFVSNGHEPSQAELLRSKARAAIPQLLSAITALNERRSGRSDRSADFRQLASWFAACENDDQAHRLARASFALNSARHFSLATGLDEEQDLPANTPWAQGPKLPIHPRLRRYGQAAPRGAMAAIKSRDEARRLLSSYLQEESEQIEAARHSLATGQATRLSDLGQLDPHAFTLFLSLLGQALSVQTKQNPVVELQSGDGLLRIRLEPLGEDTYAEIHTPAGIFAGRDHIITITRQSE